MLKGKESGQILLVVVLTMIIALTVGLSIAARVVTELRLSKQNEESQRAFQAAEAGIQQSLESKESILNPVTLENNADFSTTFINDIGQTISINNGLEVDQSVGADVWLSDYSATSSGLFDNAMGCSSGSCNSVPITIFWGSTNQNDCAGSGSDTAPAIEVVLLRGPISNPTIERSIYESQGCNRIPNSTIGVSSGEIINGITFRNQASLQFNGSNVNEGLIMKVIPIYNSTVIALRSNTNFPSQGSIVESTGTSGDTVRKVVYYQSHPQLPLEVFPYSLISQ